MQKLIFSPPSPKKAELPATKETTEPEHPTSTWSGRGVERFDYKKFHTKGLKNKDKTEQVKLVKLKGDLQSNTEHTYQSHKRKWNDGMKADLDALANENTLLPLFLQQAFAAEQVVFDKITPKTFKQMNKSKEKREWIAACWHEIEAHKENNTWTLVPRLKPNQDRKKHIIMRSLWQFKIKTENGVIIWFKACLCADGSSVNWKLKADPNIEFEDNYSGSATSTSMNLTYTIAAAYRLEVHSGDVPSAYVQSEMPEGDVVYYVEQPEGFADPTKPDHVCKLNMALYGVLVVGQRWNLTFHKFLTKELKFVCCDFDPNLYICHEQDGNFCIIPTAVDDTLDICTSQELPWRDTCEIIQTIQMEKLWKLWLVSWLLCKTKL